MDQRFTNPFVAGGGKIIPHQMTDEQKLLSVEIIGASTLYLLGVILAGLWTGHRTAAEAALLCAGLRYCSGTLRLFASVFGKRLPPVLDGAMFCAVACIGAGAGLSLFM